MPVPSSIDDLSTTASANSPSGADTPKDGDNYIRALSAFVAFLRDKFDGTSATGTIKDATFSGTQSGSATWAALQTFAAGLNVGNSASATPTTLDWYEEGSFTPAVTFGGGNTGITYATQTGRFTRIGNLVHFKVAVTLTSKGSSSGSMAITGLPYAHESGAGISLGIAYIDAFLAQFTVSAGGSSIAQFIKTADGTQVTNSSVTNSTVINAVGTYRV